MRPDPTPSAPPLLRLVGFAALFFILQSGFEAMRGGGLEQLLVHVLTLQPAAALVDLLRPDLHAQAQGASIVSPSTRLNIVAGCEGVEAILLLIAAMVVTWPSWRSVLAGIAAGALVLHVTNIVRVTVLFLAAAHDTERFAMLHGYVAPIAMIAVAMLVFHVWLAWPRPVQAPAPAGGW